MTSTATPRGARPLGELTLRALEALGAQPRWSDHPDAGLERKTIARLVRQRLVEPYASTSLDTGDPVTRYRLRDAASEALAAFRGARGRAALLPASCPIPRVRLARYWGRAPLGAKRFGRSWAESRQSRWCEVFDPFGRRFLRQQYHGYGPVHWYREEGAWYPPAARVRLAGTGIRPASSDAKEDGRTRSV